MNSEVKPTSAYVSIPEGSQVLIVRDENESLTNQTDENKIDIWVYWHTVSKHKWAILVLTLLIGLLTTLITFSLQPIYRSTALLLIEFDQAKVISIEEIYGISSFIDQYYQTQLRILNSRDLIKKVVDKLNLVSHPVFDPAAQQPGFDWHQWFPTTWLPHSEEPPTTEDRLKGIVGAVMAGLTITPVRGSQLVEISFESPDGKLAAQVPNTLIEVYIKSDMAAKLAMTEQAAKFLTNRTNALRQELSASEKTLQTYMQKENLVNVTGVKSVAIKQIEQTTSYLVSARQQFTQAKSVYQQVEKLRGYSSKAFESIPAVLNHSLVQSLKTAELDAARRISELREHYGEKHPKIIAKKAELNTARSNTAKQIELVIDGITKEYEVAYTNVKALEQSLEINKKKIKELNRKEYRLKVLQRDVDVNRQLYDLFLTRFKETNASQDIQKLQSTVGRVIENALIATVPYKPKKKRIVAISLVLGFLLSTLLAFLLEYLDNTLKDSEDVEQKLGLPLLGSLSKLKVGKKDKFKPQWMFLKESKSQFAEAVRTIRTGIMLTGIDTPQKVLVVTSSVSGEGKTTLAISQAFALGQMDKTLLIEADMRRPSIAKSFGLNSKVPGLSELVAGTRQFEECIRHLGEGDEGSIDVIVSGTVPPNPLELLASKRFQEILGQLVKNYRYIVIDSAPAMAVSDALVLAKYASEVVYVVKANATPHQIVREGLKRLRQVNVSVNGIILNQLPTRSSSRYHYSKYAYYKNYYGGSGNYGYTTQS
ncbi:MAG TPA: polysaccharide biosynthesis tyrosine autokinase [Thioploca sp.]|nr:polysaccharide biosynthesis tyrosine autokinase [Thioploca sp.]